MTYKHPHETEVMVREDGSVVGGFTMNQGAGPVQAATSPEAAARNMNALVDDLRDRGCKVELWAPLSGAFTFDELSETEASLIMGGTKHEKVHDGRFPFRLIVNGFRHVVEMPGLALDAVRYMRLEGQDIWDFPRLYIDGSSWVWFFGLDVLADANQDY